MKLKLVKDLFIDIICPKNNFFLTIVEALMKESSREINSLNQMNGTPLEQIKLLTKKMLDEQSKIGFMLIEQAKKRK